MTTDDERERLRLSRNMPGATADDIDAWLAFEPRSWVLRHGPALHAAGLDASDTTDLYRRLGATTATLVSRLIDAGRMADIDIRFIHLWAASGLMAPTVEPGTRPGTIRTERFTRWVAQARRYITACGGDQHLAALTAAAGLSVEETVTMHAAGDLDAGSLEVMAALREAAKESSS